jgi:hypothetical protein
LSKKDHFYHICFTFSLGGKETPARLHHPAHPALAALTLTLRWIKQRSAMLGSESAGGSCKFYQLSKFYQLICYGPSTESLQ